MGELTVSKAEQLRRNGFLPSNYGQPRGATPQNRQVVVLPAPQPIDTIQNRQVQRRNGILNLLGVATPPLQAISVISPLPRQGIAQTPREALGFANLFHGVIPNNRRNPTSG